VSARWSDWILAGAGVSFHARELSPAPEQPYVVEESRDVT
jgi:hypothetical protein